MEEYMLPCLNKKLFGVECFGCGMQRALVLIFQGEFVSAFYMYPAIYSLITLFIFIAINIFFKFKYSNRIIGALAIITVITIIVSYIFKIIN
ncbi:DUF2752 domain-containing protein [Tamlana sp. 2201CG12-4]|uniref:DUF2752 domain-containing protein n=1 Tax=Tamlana sp. 2201CG12-4 TaxID=3112582 RepID=UPI002DBF4E40|nr:DUF2752 domain-containing protein [Tamlana sp. 2201CG12-4]MEC3908588.1 DUF2752 domain-containing protein [Tamlana sp. 2201CG12-4]